MQDMTIKKLSKMTGGERKELLKVWEVSVRATHHFLSEQDIINLRPMVSDAFSMVENLYIVSNEGKIRAFLGVHEQKIEMLFVDPIFRGQGIGKMLVHFAFQNLDAEYVDVNEQNPQAIGFYEHMGFERFGRSETDGQGNPFPILHLRLIL